MRSRFAPIAFAATLVALVSAMTLLSGCQGTVEVETGVRVECPYGHVDDKDVTSVEVPAKTAGAYRVRTEQRVCDRHAKLEGLYAEAQAALASGDLETARAKLEQVSADDPAFRRTADQLAQLENGKKPDPDSGEASPGSTPATTSPKPKPGEGDTSGPVGSLAKYTPDTLDGFTAQAPGTDPLSVSRQYTPSGSSKVLSLVIVSEQFRDAAEAKRALEAQMKPAYAQDSSSAKINGHAVVLGTDGRAFASAGFTDGSILVVLEAAGKSGVDPQELLGTVRSVVEELP